MADFLFSVFVVLLFWIGPVFVSVFVGRTIWQGICLLNRNTYLFNSRARELKYYLNQSLYLSSVHTHTDVLLSSRCVCVCSHPDIKIPLYFLLFAQQFHLLSFGCLLLLLLLLMCDLAWAMGPFVKLIPSNEIAHGKRIKKNERTSTKGRK